MKEFKGKSISELEKMCFDKQEALRVFRFEMSGSRIKNVKAGRGIRTEIAQILTEINVQKKNI